MSLNSKIRELREISNWSQEDMAEKLDISTSSYARIERGESKLDWDKLQKIAAIFQLDVIQLIEAESHGLIVQQTIGIRNVDTKNICGERNENLVSEIEKLKLTVEYQQKIINQQASELETLKSLVRLLQKED